MRIAANCIGSAIQRDRIRREREEAILQRARELAAYTQMLESRDRLLNASAECATVILANVKMQY